MAADIFDLAIRGVLLAWGISAAGVIAGVIESWIKEEE